MAVTQPGTPPATQPGTPPDTLNDIGVLRRREIEARILAPLLERFAAEFGAERVTELAGEVVVEVAKAQGRALATSMADNSLRAFASTLGNWTKDDALTIEVRQLDDHEYAFDVTRCRYAELYRSLGVPELGALLSCNRDGTLIEGFNDRIEFTRTQTIMSGATHCDFRYRLAEPTPPSESPVDAPGS